MVPSALGTPRKERQGPQQPGQSPILGFGTWERAVSRPHLGGGGSPSAALAVPGSDGRRHSFEMRNSFLRHCGGKK